MINWTRYFSARYACVPGKIEINANWTLLRLVSIFVEYIYTVRGLPASHLSSFIRAAPADSLAGRAVAGVVIDLNFMRKVECYRKTSLCLSLVSMAQGSSFAIILVLHSSWSFYAPETGAPAELI